MLSLNGTQTTIANATSKTISWLFTTSDGTTRYWSTKNYTYSEQEYEERILPDSFNGIELNSSFANGSIMAPNTLRFTVSDPAGEFTPASFENQSLQVDLVVSDGTNETILATWKFRIVRAYKINYEIFFEAEDFFTQYLKGEYPNTRLVNELSPSSTESLPDDNLCVPVIFGTAYLPLRSLFITDARYYLLGPADGIVYTISEVRSPIDWSSESVWNDSFTYTQATKALKGVNYRVVSPIIADSNSDGNADATGLFFDNNQFLDIQAKVSRDDLVSKTDFADVIEYVLEDMGVPSADIDTGVGSSFAAAKTIFTGWGLTCNGSFFYKMSKAEALAMLLNMCHSVLRITDKIELHVLSKTSQKTISSDDVRKTAEVGDSTFQYREQEEDLNDSAYIAYPTANKPQAILNKALVQVNETNSYISSDMLEIPFVTDSQIVQKIGILYFQRVFGFDARASSDLRDDFFVLQPDDVVTVNDTKYGTAFNGVVQQITIRKDLTVSLEINKCKFTFDDWGDLNPSVITPGVDNSTSIWQPVIYGPDAAPTSGNQNIMNSRVRVGSNVWIDGNVGAIAINSETYGNQGIQLQYNAGTPRIYAGDGSTKYFKFDGTEVILRAAGITIDSTIPAIKMGSATDYLTGEGIFLGLNTAVYKAHIGDPAGQHLSYDGAGNLHITGEFTGSTSIDGTTANSWTINSDLGDVTAQLIFGRTTGGSLTLSWNGTNATLSSQTIADNALLTVDHASAANNDYAKFTAYGIEGRSYAEVLVDLSGQAGAAFSWNSQNLTSVGSIGASSITVGNTGLTVGSSIPFSDSSGTLTLQNIDALDATTEGVIEAAIDTLANLTSIQGQTIDIDAALYVEALSRINQDLTSDASPTWLKATLSQATGTAPLTISSTTKVANLNVDLVDDLHAQTLTATTPIALSADTKVLASAGITISHSSSAGYIHLPSGGSSNQILKNSGVSGTGAWGTVTENAGALAAITTISMSGQLTNTLAIGTAPFVITSTTLVSNLNADLWDGYQFADYLDQAVKTTSSPTFANLSLGTGELTAGSINRASGTLTLEIGGTAELSITSTETTFGGNIVIPASGYVGPSGDTDLVNFASGALTVNGSLTIDEGYIKAQGDTQGEGRLIALLEGSDQWEWYPQTTGLFLYNRGVDGGGGGNVGYKITVLGSGKVGIGTTAPDGTLHVQTSTAGTVTAHADVDNLVVENSGHSGISILSPDAYYGGLTFGTPSDNFGAYLLWNYTGNAFYVGSHKTGASTLLVSGNGTTALTLDSSQNATFAGDLRVDGGDIGLTADTDLINLASGILTVNGQMKPSGSIISQSASFFDLYTNTSDGTDTKATRIGGGGDVTSARGAFAAFYGNEHATNPGDLILYSGNVAGGDILLYPKGTLGATFSDTGLTLVGALIVTSLTDGYIPYHVSDVTGLADGPMTYLSDNLTLFPAGDIILNPTGNDILPSTNYDLNLGSITKKYLTLHAAELWVENLTIQDTMCQVGGRMLIPINATELTSDLTDVATTIYVKHNSLASGDRIYLQSLGKVEFMSVDSAAGGVGPYSYTVTRNLDGTGANEWAAGSAVCNTGTTGDGLIDLYSLRSIKSASHVGPTIVGWIRNSDTYNDLTEGWAIGNLNGLYGYGVDTYGAAFGKYSIAPYLTIDPTNGIRFLDAADAVQAQLTGTTWTLGLAASEHISISSTAIQIKDGANVYTDLTAGVLTLGLTSGGEYVLVDSTGIEIWGNAVKNFEITSAGIGYFGDQSNEHIKLSSTGMQIYDGASLYATFAATSYMYNNAGAKVIEIGANGVKIGRDIDVAAQTYMYMKTDGKFQVINNSAIFFEVDEGDSIQIGNQAAGHTQFIGNQVIFYDEDGTSELGHIENNGIYFKDDSGHIQLQITDGEIVIGYTSEPNIRCDATNILMRDGATNIGAFSTAIWMPYGSKLIDLGQDANCFDDAYADDWNNVADYYHLDSYDDLAVLSAIKSSGIIDERTGLELIDDDTLPEWMLVKYKRDVYDEDGKLLSRMGDITRDSDGKPYLSTKMFDSLLRGGIVQLNKKYEEHLLKFHTY